jgi:hypothetical protein
VLNGGTMANEIFRLVGLRHSQYSGTIPTEDSSDDPRLRYQPALDAQANVTRSAREQSLLDLKKQYVQVMDKIRQFEAVQSAVVNAYMAEDQTRLAPATTPSDDRIERAAAPRAADADVSLPVVVNSEAFLDSVESRLSDPHAALFRDAINSVPRTRFQDVADLSGLFEVNPLIDEGNRLCAEIHTLEDDAGAGLPTVKGGASPSTQPIVAAVGWGDLIVARETLVGYEANEIAHIENILPGEAKLREHQRVTKSEQVDETETTTEKETEKDSQTTDRYELQAQSQETIARNFSISAGVNTSGKYGLTQVDTSLDAAFSQSQQQSHSSSLDTAREVVSKAVERTFERVRVLRRLVLTEEIHELNRHELTNQGDSATPKAISGIYLWVEKIQKVELRQYGRRMMVEFHVPEPALSLFERVAEGSAKRSLPPFEVAPTRIDPSNYMCLAQRYGATDVEPPPGLYVEVGWGWTSTTNEDVDQWAEDQFTATMNIPAGYRPGWAKVAWSALRGKQENREFNFAFSVGGKSQGIEHTVNTYDGVVLQLDTGYDWPQGVPVSGRLHGAWDGAMYIQVTLKCVRTPEALDAWRLRTWESLRAGYEALERKAGQDEQQRAYREGFADAASTERAPAENRRIERNELQKWAIKSMRLAPQNLNAIEQVGGDQEINPSYADAQAPIVRFYEEAFEWEHMNYFLHPYYWARRASWHMRSAAQSVDPVHQAFLQAGAARVIVPITPGFEDKVAWFLDRSNPASSELARILATPPGTPPSSSSTLFRDLWVELLTDQKPDLARGSGTLRVTNGNADVQINPDSEWKVSESRDLGREVYIVGDRYEVASVTNDSAFSLDHPFNGASDEAAVYVAGSAPFGPPWTVNVPTSLIVLADNVAALKML